MSVEEGKVLIRRWYDNVPRRSSPSIEDCTWSTAIASIIAATNRRSCTPGALLLKTVREGSGAGEPP